MKILLLRFQKRVSSKRGIPWHYSFYKDILESQGHTVDIADNQVENRTLEESVDIVLKNGYQLVGIGGIGTVYKEVKVFSEQLKSKKNDVVIVVGGQVVADYEFVINSCPIDIIALGEGEITLSKIVKCFEHGDDLENVPGVVFKKNGRVIVTENEVPISMDDLPDYNFKNIKIDNYRAKDVPDKFMVDEKAISLREQGYRYLAVYLSRGCPYNCFFCYRHIKGYRTYSIERLDQILENLKNNGCRFFSFADECLTANKKYLKAVCELAKKHEIYWDTSGRVDHINHETLKMIKQSNCAGVQYGVESFDDNMLKAMNKRVTGLQNTEAMNLNYQYGLITVLQLVLGAPGEDRKSIFNTRKGMWSCFFAYDHIACAILNPYPGSPAYYYGIENGYITDKKHIHEEFAGKGKITINFSKLSDTELELWRKWLICEAHINYRIKHLALRLNREFVSELYWFTKAYALFLFKEPTNFIKFTSYLLKGFAYWLRPVKKLKWASLATD